MDNRLLIINKVIEIIPFFGVSDNTLLKACTELNISESFCKFPEGIYDVINEFENSLTLKMQEELATLEEIIQRMKIRDRIKYAVQLRLSHYANLANYRELLKQLYTFYILPQNICFTNKILFKTVSDIWHAIGDTTTDFNYYTKRFTLAAVYTSTILYFIHDLSHEHTDTLLFLDRRIDNVMKFHKFKNYMKSFMPNFKIFDVEFNA